MVASGYAMPGSDIGSQVWNVQKVTVRAAHKLCYHSSYYFRAQIKKIIIRQTIKSRQSAVWFYVKADVDSSSLVLRAEIDR